MTVIDKLLDYNTGLTNDDRLEISEEVEKLRLALEDANLFAVWVECLGRTDCEIYKHELKSSADLTIQRIHTALGV